MDSFRVTYFQWRGNKRDLQCGVISGEEDEEEEEAVFLKKLYSHFVKINPCNIIVSLCQFL